MTKTTNAGLMCVGAIVLLAMFAFAYFVELDGPGLAGTAIGAGLGLVNLVVGWKVSAHVLKRGMKSAMSTLLGGFLARMILLCGLLLLFHKLPGVDEVAFALSFMVFFFIYVALEIVLVERALQRKEKPA